MQPVLLVLQGCPKERRAGGNQGSEQAKASTAGYEIESPAARTVVRPGERHVEEEVSTCFLSKQSPHKFGVSNVELAPGLTNGEPLTKMKNVGVSADAKIAARVEMLNSELLRGRACEASRELWACASL